MMARKRKCVHILSPTSVSTPSRNQVKKKLKQEPEALQQSAPLQCSNSNYENIQLECTKTCAESDIFSQIFASKKALRLNDDSLQKTVRMLTPISGNLVHCMYGTSLGNHASYRHKQSFQSAVVSMVADMQLCRTASPFDRRCTAMEWHPSKQHLLAVGSKGGDIIIWNTASKKKDHFIPGIGPGGSVQALKFIAPEYEKIITASVDGTVVKQDLEGRGRQIILDSMNCYDYWYCGVDVNDRRKLIVAGNNCGNITLLSTEGKKLWNYRLHKQKVTHLEFSPREDWLLCSASTDNTVQLWDIRMVKERKSTLAVLKHDKAVSSAYFSLTNGTRLLTTDMHHEIRVYQAPHFHLETTVTHPHRFFQHITPIKAFWHPLQDIFAVGRYPDENLSGHVGGNQRCIDMYSADSGDLLCQLKDPGAPGIISLNKFNPSGDQLASTMGVNILLWSRKEEALRLQEALMMSMGTSEQRRGNTGSQGRGNPGQDSRRSGPENKNKITKIKKQADGKKASNTATSKQTASMKLALKLKNSKK